MQYLLSLFLLTSLGLSLIAPYARAEDPLKNGELIAFMEAERTPWKVSGFDGSTTANSATLIWRTEVLTTAVLNIGLSADDLSLQSVDVPEAKIRHLVTVPGLAPGTRFYFQVTATDEDGNAQLSEIISKKTKTP